MPRWLMVLNPVSSMRTVYGPFGSAARTNSPLASLTLSRATPVPSCVASTLAPGMTARGIIANESDQRRRRDLSVDRSCCEEKKREPTERPVDGCIPTSQGEIRVLLMKIR